jgi:hypothetical protein
MKGTIMGSRFTILLLAALLAAACAPVLPAQSPTGVATEPSPTSPPAETRTSPTYSESLLLVRWDSKALHHILLPVDPTTGTAVPNYLPIDLGVNYFYAFSPDHNTLAILSYANDSPANPILHIVDQAKWQETTHQLNINGWVSALAFSPEGRRIAISAFYRERSLLLYDLALQTMAAQVQPDYEITNMRFTLDGKSLMTYGHMLVDRFTENERSEGSARVGLFKAEDLSPVWSSELTGVQDGIYAVDDEKSTQVHQPGNGLFFYPGLAFAPESNTLYVVHADGGRLTTVDFKGQSFKTMDLQPKLSWVEKFLMFGALSAHAKAESGTSRQAVISPDGKIIYTVGNKTDMHLLTNGEWELTSSWLNLQGIRISDGTVILDQEVSASGLRITPQGDRLLIEGWAGDEASAKPQTRVFDTEEAVFTGIFAQAHPAPTRRRDGSPVLASNDPMPYTTQSTRMAVYDYETGELIGEWISPTYAAWLIEP